jgi:hypothetical protein
LKTHCEVKFNFIPFLKRHCEAKFNFIPFLKRHCEAKFNFITFLKRHCEAKCAGSSGAVHNVVLIDVYLDLENPGGSGFWVGKDGWVTEGTERVSLRAPGS